MVETILKQINEVTSAFSLPLFFFSTFSSSSDSASELSPIRVHDIM
jgi:hypothetical protein